MHQDSIYHDILIFWKCFNGLKNTFVYQIKKFVPSFFKVYPNRHLYLHTFLRKTPWKLYDPFITFRLQMWTINYMHISKSFSVCLWNIFENITGMPLRGHLLAARITMCEGLRVIWRKITRVLGYGGLLKKTFDISV